MLIILSLIIRKMATRQVSEILTNNCLNLVKTDCVLKKFSADAILCENIHTLLSKRGICKSNYNEITYFDDIWDLALRFFKRHHNYDKAFILNLETFSISTMPSSSKGRLCTFQGQRKEKSPLGKTTNA